MISQGGKNILSRFVTTAKELLMQNVTSLLQQHYGIWKDGHQINIDELANQDTDIVYTAKMLRERLTHIISSLPDNTSRPEEKAVDQLISEQAFTILNRFCALRMCEERGLIYPSVSKGYNSDGFIAYDSVAIQLQLPQYNRYVMYIQSVFDELSIELPSVFDRYSPYGLVFPDENTLLQLFDIINQEDLSAWYDDVDGTRINFWKEDETLGWMFQYYNSLEDRRRMREESGKPRNSREMAVRNQFFTPEYVVQFLTDNTLGRIWYEMTNGRTEIATKLCTYMVIRPNETYEPRQIKEPTEILTMDPTCGSMHFGLYAYDVYEFIYMDAWDNHPELLQEYRELNTRESFSKLIPGLILEKNLYGCEIDPRALQIAALSLWLRAQRSYSELNLTAEERPIIKKTNLVLAESMPGNKRLLNGLMDELPKPMQNLIKKIWDKMQFVGEAGLLFKMEKEIDAEIEYLRQNWTKVNQYRYAGLFDSDEEKAKIMMENEARRALKANKEEFFKEITARLNDALHQLSARLSEEEGYENVLFGEDATRGFAFIELCQKRFDCIVMNPPFGEGSENTSPYLEDNYPLWGKNLVCAFFIRMKEMLIDSGKLGAIFDKSILVRNSYEAFRKSNICGAIFTCADTSWGVLDANVETSTLVLSRTSDDKTGVFFNIQEEPSDTKRDLLITLISNYNKNLSSNLIFTKKSEEFVKLPNSVIGYYFDDNITSNFQSRNLTERGFAAINGNTLSSVEHYRLYFEILDKSKFKHMYNGSTYSLFYSFYRELCLWGDDAKFIKNNSHVVLRNQQYQFKKGVGYGKRGDIIDAHILKSGMAFTVEGFSIPLTSPLDIYTVNSLLNSIFGQYMLNLYTGQHKHVGYVNLLPMPDYDSRQSDIERIVNAIIYIKRQWFSLDETNLEYHGLIAQLNISTSAGSAIDKMQEQLTSDYIRYQELVKENDDLWMDLADIKSDSDFRKTLNNYKQRRPSEELLSIDGASELNVINKKVIAQEIIMELVGMAFGRWDSAYATGKKAIPEFGDVFDALPFMPVVSLESNETAFLIPEDGILSMDPDSPLSLAGHVRDVMLEIWGDQADEIEYELCQLINCRSLQIYLEQPSGFFAYHFKRYTKSHRKAPIYWPISSEDGSITYWVYYPSLSINTIPSLILKLKDNLETTRRALTSAKLAHDKVKESELSSRQQQIEWMMNKLTEIRTMGYVPNHDDGVPVTAAPFADFFQLREWRQVCAENMSSLEKGEYDWSHLAYSLYPSRITQKAKKDWCLALTHGLESICENKPKEKKSRKKNSVDSQTTLNLE